MGYELSDIETCNIVATFTVTSRIGAVVAVADRMLSTRFGAIPQHGAVREALEGHHPQSQDDLITWLDDTVAGWNANPTPFVWHGKRFERRQRARQRRLGGAPASPAQSQPIAA